MKLSIIALCLIFSNSILSQNTCKNESENWEKSIAFRGAIGVHKSFFSELGISKFYFLDTNYFPITKSYYTTLEFSPTLKPQFENDIYGLKAGYEITAVFLSIGLEAKYQTDFVKNDFIISPRIGLGYVGILNFYYGFNISTAGKPFERIGLHQFSINVNFNKSIKENF